MRPPRYTRADLGWALLVGAATFVANGFPFGGGADADVLQGLTYNTLQFGLPCVLLLRLADTLTDDGRIPAWLVYPAVVLLTVGLGVWVIAPSLYPWLGKAPWWTSLNDWMLASTTLVWHGLGVAVYAQARLSARAQQRLASLQQRAAERSRGVAAARLLALQARVEPALLFEQLQRIDRELQRAPIQAEAQAQAQAHLTALIDLMRAQQPHLRMEISTLARELASVHAYARLVSHDGRHTERLNLAPLAELPDWPMAPLVLLPLVRPLLDRGRSLWRLEPVRPGLLGLQRAGLRLQAIGPDAASAHEAASHVPLAELQQRLREVHGERADITLEDAHEGRLACFSLSWPLPALTP